MAAPRRAADLVGRELRWVRGARGAGYELRDGDDVVATLRFRHAWGTLATAESADGCWTFQRSGFLHTRATIRECGRDGDVAVFKNHSWKGGGTLELAGGCRIEAETSGWMTKFGFTTETGDALVRFTKIGGVLKLSSSVEVLPAGAALADAPWLVMLGWYLTIQMHSDAAVAVSAVG